MKKAFFAVITVLFLLPCLFSCFPTEDDGLDAVCAHEFTAPTCAEPSVCRLCGEIGEGPLGHDMAKASCSYPAYCVREGCQYTEGETVPHTLVMLVEGDLPRYNCSDCGAGYSPETGVYLDGESHDGMVGVFNKNNYATHENGDLPIINEDGQYELINTSDKNAQMQLWIPSNDSKMEGFSSNNWAVGFFSFKMSAYFGGDFTMKFADTSADADRWSNGWCIRDPFITLSNIHSVDGKMQVILYGWDDIEIAVLAVDPDTGFCEWMDISIGITLTPNDDLITLYYYSSGEYRGCARRELTTVTNAINAIYVNGSTGYLGSGVVFDETFFGFRKNVDWPFDRVEGDCPHEWLDADCEHPMLCALCGAARLTPLGHDLSSPDCQNPAKCMREGCSFTTGSPLPHDFSNAKCGEYATCARDGCGYTTDYRLDHDLVGATCESPSVCRRDGCPYTVGEPLGHDIHPAGCETSAYCLVCLKTLGEPLGHDFVGECGELGVCSRDGCGAKSEEPIEHTVVISYVHALPTYSCEGCDYLFTPEYGVYLNGEDHDGMRGVNNSENYTVSEATQLPLINDEGEYELINVTGERAQAQLWIPADDSFAQFTSERGAVGFLSFSINICMDVNFQIKLVDSSSDGGRWSPEWCITEQIFYVTPPKVDDGRCYVGLMGFGGILLDRIEVEDESSFTGKIDVAIRIALDARLDSVIIDYYLAGEHAGEASTKLTTSTNGINSVYLNGNTSALGSGLIIGDLSFVYATDVYESED